MTVDALSGAAGVLLSLVFAYVPKLNAKFAALQTDYKRLIMLAALAVVAGSAFGLACAGVLQDLFGLALTCDKGGALGLIRAFVFAVIANQGVYAILPEAGAVKEVKALQG